MNDNRQKKLLIVITNGFAATNVIHSGLIQHMARLYELHILSDLLGENEIRAINRHFGINVKLFCEQIPAETAILKPLRLIGKAVFFRHFHIVTQTIRESQQAFWLRYSTGAFANVLECLGITRSVLVFLRKVIIARSKRMDIAIKIEQQQFDGIIFSDQEVYEGETNVTVTVLVHGFVKYGAIQKVDSKVPTSKNPMILVMK